MFKEIILTVILGTLLGFGLTGGYFAIKRSSPNSAGNITPTISIIKSGITPSTINSTPTPTLDSSNNQITINSPENESIVSNSKVTIKGSSNPQSTIIITTVNKSYIIHSDDAGNFNTEIEVDSGANQIQIDAIDTNDNQSTTKLVITYSTAKL